MNGIFKLIGGCVLFCGTLIGSYFAGRAVGEGIEELMDK